MNIYYSAHFQKKLTKYEKKKDPLIRQKIKKALTQLTTDNLTKGIRLHKVTISGAEAWSVSLDLKIRLIFVYVEEGILLTDLGSHDEVYN